MHEFVNLASKCLIRLGLQFNLPPPRFEGCSITPSCWISTFLASFKGIIFLLMLIRSVWSLGDASHACQKYFGKLFVIIVFEFYLELFFEF